MTHNNYNDLELEIYYGVSGLNSIESDWNRLVNEVNNKRYYHYYEWYDSYINSLEHEPESVLFCVFRNATNVVAIVPLKRTEWRFSAFSLTVLEIPSHPHLPLRDIVFPECYQSESITKSILNILKKSDRLDWDIINLSGLLEDSLAAKSFGNCQSRNISEDVKYNAYLKISPCETVFKTISSSMRNNLKRLRKRLMQKASTRSKL